MADNQHLMRAVHNPMARRFSYAYDAVAGSDGCGQVVSGHRSDQRYQAKMPLDKQYRIFFIERTTFHRPFRVSDFM